jgi:hypothetical protein
MMPTRTPGTSKQEAPTRDAAAARDTLEGESLPELAARDEARLLVQSPRRLFLYWNFARDPRATLRRAFRASAERFELCARLVDLEEDAPGDFVGASGREVWFDARPHRSYSAEVGFYADGFPFVRVLTSNVAQTPADTISALTDASADFQIGVADLSRLLATSGFANAVSSDATDANVEESGAYAATLVSPVSSFALINFAPSSFVLGVTAPERQD